jgi:hypothetical protein
VAWLVLFYSTTSVGPLNPSSSSVRSPQASGHRPLRSPSSLRRSQVWFALSFVAWQDFGSRSSVGPSSPSLRFLKFGWPCHSWPGKLSLQSKPWAVVRPSAQWLASLFHSLIPSVGLSSPSHGFSSLVGPVIRGLASCLYSPSLGPSSAQVLSG